MKTIPLTKSKEAIVDDQFYRTLTAMGSWCFHPKGYAVRTERRNGRQRTLLMHRVVWLLAGRDLPRQLDHKNTNKIDNRLSNLRSTTSSQNHANEVRRANNRSGYKGVSWHKASNKWRANITVRNRSKQLGVFETREDAARAYDKAAIRHFGQFARTNFKVAA